MWLVVSIWENTRDELLVPRDAMRGFPAALFCSRFPQQSLRTADIRERIMAAQIPITSSYEHLLRVAHLLSSHLQKLGIDHAYIGRFAWSLLGSRRLTDINLAFFVVKFPMRITRATQSISLRSYALASARRAHLSFSLLLSLLDS